MYDLRRGASDTRSRLQMWQSKMEKITLSYPIRVRPTALIVRDNVVLLAEYPDERGVHYNLIGGGVEAGETIQEALGREILEETGYSDINIGKLILVHEFEPQRDKQINIDAPHTLDLIFHCELPPDAVPSQPAKLDPGQVGISWVPLEDLPNVTLLPALTKQILAYLNGDGVEDLFIEDHSLPPIVW